MTIDERQPLLHPEANHHTNKPPSEPPPEDPENPQTWKHSYKLLIVLLLALMAFTVTFTCISLVPLSNRIVASLDSLSGRPSTSYASILLITIWELGEAAGPLLIAPLSEVYGRAPVFHAANGLFILSTAAAALSQSTGVLVFMRFITGVSVASNVLNPAVIGDMFPPDQRGRAMSLVMLTPLMGGAIGPAVAGAVAQGLGWRAVLWMSVGLAVVVEVMFVVLFRETYLPAILRSRIQKEKSEGKADEADYDDDELDELKVQPKSLIWQSIKRPATIFAGSFVLQIMSLYGAVMFSFFYIVSTTLPGILQDRYGFPPALVGSSFLSFSIGSLLGILVNNTLLDRIYLRLTPAGTPAKPENRLPLTILGAFTLPLTIILYGFSASLHLPYLIVLLAVLLMGFTIMLGLVPMMSYIVDAFGVYSASALTAVLITRCLMSTLLPLAVAPLEQRLGYGWGMTVLAAVGLGLAPVPWMVMRFGGGWRQGCEFSKG